MVTVGEILRSIREVIVINERVAVLAERVGRIDTANTDLRDRVTRMEVFFELLRPHIQPALPSPNSTPIRPDGSVDDSH